MPGRLEGGTGRRVGRRSVDAGQDLHWEKKSFQWALVAMFCILRDKSFNFNKVQFINFFLSWITVLVSYLRNHCLA